MNKLKPCPFCGFRPDADDPDCLYPAVRDRSVWGVNCYESGGGCSASILGASAQDCIEKWQRRAESSASGEINGRAVGGSTAEPRITAAVTHASGDQSPSVEPPLPATPPHRAGTSRDWTEDAAHENGGYQCQCVECGQMFYGHKRRHICKACAEPLREGGS